MSLLFFKIKIHSKAAFNISLGHQLTSLFNTQIMLSDSIEWRHSLLACFSSNLFNTSIWVMMNSNKWYSVQTELFNKCWHENLTCFRESLLWRAFTSCSCCGPELILAPRTSFVRQLLAFVSTLRVRNGKLIYCHINVVVLQIWCWKKHRSSSLILLAFNHYSRFKVSKLQSDF